MISAQHVSRAMAFGAWLCGLGLWACEHDAAVTPVLPEPASSTALAPAPATLAVDPAPAELTNCARFYYGHGTAADRGRARRCFERAVAAETGCQGASPSFDRFFLATMTLGGQGGPSQPDRARALLVDCYPDITVLTIRGLEPGAAQGDPCEGVAFTTVAMNECAGVIRDGVEVESAALASELEAKLSERGKQGLRLAEQRFAAFLRIDSDASSELYRGGSIQGQLKVGHQIALIRARNERLRDLLSGSQRAALSKEAVALKLEAAHAAARAAGDVALLTASDRAFEALQQADAVWLGDFSAAARARYLVQADAQRADELHDHASL
jgi:hypothetical protein